MTQRTVKIDSFAPGVNNRLEPTQLKTRLDDGTRASYLYGGENVDINDKGYVKRRRGTTQRLAGSAHSIWGDGKGGAAVINGSLLTLSAAGGGPLVTTTVRAGMPRFPVSYSRGADGDLYWTNGIDIRRITAAGADRPVAPDTPAFIPVTATTGNMPAGRYLIAFTRVSIDGESPATMTQAIELSAPGGLAFTAPADVETFVSGPNGDILTSQGTGLQGLAGYSDGGRRCPTLNTAVIPAGTIVRHYNGCMLVAAGPVLYISLPYNYGIVDLAKGYIPFPAPITVIEPTDNGTYICADKTYWIADLLVDGGLQELLPYGAIPGTSGRSPNSESVFWQSVRGLVTGDKNMGVKNVQEEALEIGTAVSGASLFREQDGMTHVVATRSGAEPSMAVARSFMDAEVIRKGTRNEL